jgi:hypothetical protein
MALPLLALADGGGGDGGQSTVGTLILDNKDSTTWQRIADGKYGVFTYNSSGPTLDWSLAVTGLGTTPTAYSLIYFADPYPGNKPGALIWSGTSGTDGRIDVALTNTDLGIDLPTAPDSNMLVSHAGPPDLYTTPLGAKIWLIPSVYYNADTKSVIAWNTALISSTLFETDLILYTDTNKPSAGGTSLVTTVTMPASILSLGVSPVQGLNYGSVSIGSCSGWQDIVLTNTGTVPITVTALPSAGFYTTSLYFGSILAKDWVSAKILPSGTLTLNTKVCPLPGLTGTLTGSVAFIATFAP